MDLKKAVFEKYSGSKVTEIGSVEVNGENFSLFISKTKNGNSVQIGYFYVKGEYMHDESTKNGKGGIQFNTNLYFFRSLKMFSFRKYTEVEFKLLPLYNKLVNLDYETLPKNTSKELKLKASRHLKTKTDYVDNFGETIITFYSKNKESIDSNELPNEIEFFGATDVYDFDVVNFL